MPHLLNNSVVNLDILPESKAESKPEEMADKAQEGANEGADSTG